MDRNDPKGAKRPARRPRAAASDDSGTRAWWKSSPRSADAPPSGSGPRTGSGSGSGSGSGPIPPAPTGTGRPWWKRRPTGAPQGTIRWLLFLLLVAAGFLGYEWFRLSSIASDRYTGQGWKFPTRVYADWKEYRAGDLTDGLLVPAHPGARAVSPRVEASGSAG